MRPQLIVFLCMTPIVALSQTQDQSCALEEPNEGIEKLVKAIHPASELCSGINICKHTPYAGCDSLKETINHAQEYINNQGVGRCNLSDEEIATIYYYIGNGYSCINSFLRKPSKEHKAIRSIEKAINSGLDKLPSYEGFVRRGASLPQDIRAQHIKGAVVTYPAFTSTSTANGLTGTDNFIIFSRTGKPVMGYSTMRQENEVLFKSNTRFKVLDVKTKGGQHTYIMREVVDEEEAKNLEEDRRILERLKAIESERNEFNTDSWLCPKDATKVPKRIIQKYFPISA